MAETAKVCRNCRAPVAGEYCARCGQREGRADQRFLDLAGDLAGDLFDLDSRLWRTLFFLLLRPGYLSAEFIAGRRARYLPPLRLYLVISFILFLAMNISITAGPAPAVELEAAGTGVNAEASGEWDGEVGLADADSPQWLRDVDRRLEEKIGRVRDEPGALNRGMLEYIPQLMFLLLPLFALLIQIAYLFAGYHYLQHLVFALHFHSFTYLAYLLALALEYAGFQSQGWVLMAALVYLPLALRRTYGASWKSAVTRSLFILVSYAVLLAIGFGAVAMIALYML